MWKKVLRYGAIITVAGYALDAVLLAGMYIDYQNPHHLRPYKTVRALRTFYMLSYASMSSLISSDEDALWKHRLDAFGKLSVMNQGFYSILIHRMFTGMSPFHVPFEHRKVLEPYVARCMEDLPTAPLAQSVCDNENPGGYLLKVLGEPEIKTPGLATFSVHSDKMDGTFKIPSELYYQHGSYDGVILRELVKVMGKMTNLGLTPEAAGALVEDVHNAAKPIVQMNKKEIAAPKIGGFKFMQR